MIQMKLNQVVYKYIDRGFFKIFCQRKSENQIKNLSKKWNTFEEEGCGFEVSRKDYEFKILFFNYWWQRKVRSRIL